MRDPAPIREIRVEDDPRHCAKITVDENRVTFVITVRDGTSVTGFCASREDMQSLLLALQEMLK